MDLPPRGGQVKQALLLRGSAKHARNVMALNLNVASGEAVDRLADLVFDGEIAESRSELCPVSIFSCSSCTRGEHSQLGSKASYCIRNPPDLTVFCQHRFEAISSTYRARYSTIWKKAAEKRLTLVLFCFGSVRKVRQMLFERKFRR